MHYDEEINETIKEKIEIDTKHLRKQTAGKVEGARYCYIDIMPLVTGWEDTTVHWACLAFNDFLQHRQLYDIICCFDYIIQVDDKILDGIINVRYKAIKSGKYPPFSYKEEVDVDLLLDAAARHMIKHLNGTERDDESGELHLAHFCANLLMIAGQIYK